VIFLLKSENCVLQLLILSIKSMQRVEDPLFKWLLLSSDSFDKGRNGGLPLSGRRIHELRKKEVARSGVVRLKKQFVGWHPAKLVVET